MESIIKSLEAYNDEPLYEPNSQKDVQHKNGLEWEYQIAKTRFNHFITFALLAMDFGIEIKTLPNY